jgi:hypothetical protein
MAAAQELMKKGFFDLGGVPSVMLQDGHTMRLSEWRNMPNQLPVIGQANLLGFLYGQNTPTAQVPLYKQTPMGLPASSGEFAPSPQASANIEQQAQAMSNDPGRIAYVNTNNPKVWGQLEENAVQAVTSNRGLTNLASALSQTSPDGALSGGPFQDYLKTAASAWNWAMKTAGAPPEVMVDETQLTAAHMREKLSAGLQFSVASAAGQRAAQALEQAAVAQPGGRVPRHVGIELVANNIIDNQSNLDARQYELAARAASRNPQAYDASMARTEFSRDPKFSNERYARDRDSLMRLMEAVDTATGHSLFEEVRNGKYSDAKGRKSVEEVLRAPGITRYVAGI